MATAVRGGCLDAECVASVTRAGRRPDLGGNTRLIDRTKVGMARIPLRMRVASHEGG